MPFSWYNAWLLSYLVGIPVMFILGVELEVEGREHLNAYGPSIIIANHQSNYDLFLFLAMKHKRTVSLGKVELLYIPVFGLWFWLTGSVPVNRKNHKAALKSMIKVKDTLLKKKRSIIIMPEGTRSKGKGLLPFKKGAFHTAISTQVPLIPVCISSWHKNINLTNWKAGKIIIKVLPAIESKGYDKSNLSDLSDKCREAMLVEIKALNSKISS